MHLFSEHFDAARTAALAVGEFKSSRKRVIDEEWLVTKPKWRKYLHWPASFALLWRRN